MIDSRQKEKILRRARLANRCDGFLDCIGPIGDAKLMRFIHKTKRYFGLTGVFFGELRPERVEVSVGNRAIALANDAAIPSAVVVDADYAEFRDGQT